MNCRASLAVLLLTLPAHAVIVRGRVTDPLGRPLPGARVQLIHGPRSAGDAIAGVDGTYEIRSADSGRFLLLTSSGLKARYPAVQIGAPFYAGRTDLVERDVFLDPAYLTPQVSAQATLLASPLPRLAETTTQVAADQFLTAATPLLALRQLPSAFLVQRGTAGTDTALYLRGAGPETIKLTIAGASAENFGGGFNFGTLSTTGLNAIAPTPVMELTPGALPLSGLEAEGGFLALHQPEATEVRPSLAISGDAGNLSTLRGEGTGEITRKRADLRGGFSRFDTDSGSPRLGFHLATGTADLGYNISAASSLRLLVQRDVAAAPLAFPEEIYNLQPLGKDSSQNLYSSLSFNTVSAKHWHNQVTYGLTRKRRQEQVFTAPSEGLPVELMDANGATARGVAALPPLARREDFVTNRDELSYETDYPVTANHTALLRFDYQDERAADLLPAKSARFERQHLAIEGGAQGDLFGTPLHHRVLYEVAALADRSSALGLLGAPRVGLTVIPVFPGTRRFRGTTLHVTAAAGFGEPGAASLKFAQQAGFTASAPRSRTFSFGVDQVLLPQKLTVRATYFHSQLSHQPELLAFDSVSPTAAYRTQVIEMAVHYQPFPRLFVAGGYTYLAAVVEQTAERATFNPAFGSAPIGALGALAGARPFDRPPHTGWLAVHYTGTRLSLAVEGNLAGRSDSSTGVPQTPGLLLPNRNLSPGYVDLNASAMYRIGKYVSVYTQLENLLNDRHIAPYGFLSTPFLVRTGLRFRFGGD